MRILLLVLVLCTAAQAQSDWVELFDGKSLKGWKASENSSSWSVRHGALFCHGPRSHLFYTGEPFQDFEFQAEVKTMPGSNSGIYFLTQYQEEGWPKNGFEAQVNNSYALDPVRTGSLYGLEKLSKSRAKDLEWFTQSVTVRGQTIIIKVNGTIVVHHRLKSPPAAGTFALQAHDPNSKVYFRNLRVRRLKPGDD